MPLKDILCDTTFPDERDSEDDKKFSSIVLFYECKKSLRQKTGRSLKTLVGDTVLKEGGAKGCSQYLSARGRNVAEETKT